MTTRHRRRHRPIRIGERTTLRMLLADVAADLDRRVRRAPEPLPEQFSRRLIATIVRDQAAWGRVFIAAATAARRAE